jgi:hypothetical protein
MQSSSPACGATQSSPPLALRQGQERTCPVPGDDHTSCLSNRELGEALSSMAANGLRIASTVMRALAGEANRLLSSEPDL